MTAQSRITAVLGPTNTGKTHYAIERMLAHRTGVIGLPLRLLAREVYDRITARIGEAEVALVTGEEKRVPRRPRYWVCTVEADRLIRIGLRYVKGLGLEVATPDEAREILHLKGADRTAI